MLLKLFSRLPKPFDTGFLPEQDGHQVYYHQYGAKDGQPVLYFHAGPGHHSKPVVASLFNLKKYRVVLFDQRGCGKSKPVGSIEHNTTAHLLSDARHLLDHLNIDKAIVFGSSWGATLALLFAQTYPHSVRKIILVKTFLARQCDADAIWQKAAAFYPDLFKPLCDTAPMGMSVRDTCNSMALSPDRNTVVQSLKLYGPCESWLGTFDPDMTVTEPDDKDLHRWRVYRHYDQMRYGIVENQILDNISKIAHLPALIVHNRGDMICTPDQAWLVAQNMQDAKLVFVPDFGHGSELLNTRLKQEITGFLR